MTVALRKAFAVTIALILLGAQSQATPVYTPAAVQKQSKNLIDREIAVRGIFTLLGGSMVLVEDPAVYATAGNCCGLPSGKFLLLRRSKDIWNVRERYEGATMTVRGRLQRQHCWRDEGRDRCDDDRPTLTIDGLDVAANVQRAVVLERLNDLVPVDEASPDRRALNTVAADIHARISRNDDAGLLSRFAPDLYAGYAPDTFRAEYGQKRIASREHSTRS